MKQLLDQSFELILNAFNYLFKDLNNYIISNQEWLFTTVIMCLVVYLAYYLINKLKFPNFRFNKIIGGSLLLLTFILFIKYDDRVNLAPRTISSTYSINPSMQNDIIDVRGQIISLQRMTYDTEDYLGDKGFLIVAWDKIVDEDILSLVIFSILFGFVLSYLYKIVVSLFGNKTPSIL